MKIRKGPLKGCTVVFDTPGETVDVCCRNCDYTRWQMFFIENYSDEDIGENCPKCGGELYINGTSSTDRKPSLEDIEKVLSDPDFTTKLR